MKINKIYIVVFFAFLHQASATPSSKTEIVFGQSACLTGPLGLYSNIIQKAILMRMYRVNDLNGIKGKKLKLVSLNDDGDPRKTQKNVDQLLKSGIDMFIGNTGTRSSLKLLPLVKSEKIALFFPWSGDEKLRNPSLTNIINGPGLMKPQLTAIVDYINNNIKLKKIAIFHADDDFSTDTAKDLVSALAKNNIQPTAIASYNRFTLDIATPAATLRATDPKIVICLSTSMPAVKLINYFFTNGNYGTTFFGIDSTLFVPDIVQARGAEFYYSSAVPNPLTSTIPLAKQYLDDLHKYFPQEIPNILGFSYYLSTAIIIDAITSISGSITKAKIIRTIEKMKKFDAKNRQAFGQEISIIKG